MAYNDFNMDNHWLPFTPNRSFKKNPRVFTGADGMEFTTHDGKQAVGPADESAHLPPSTV